MGRAGDGSTLSLDFTTMGGVLDPRLTFSRASTATFVNSQGYVEYAGANLLLQSENISSGSWSDQNGATRLQVSITNPIGGATSTQVTSGTASNAISQGPTYQAGLPHVIRIWVRAGTSSQLQLGVFAGGFVTGTISVISGTATVSGTGLFLATGLTATWTQLQIVYSSLTGSGAVLIYPDTASPVTGRTIYVWGAQLNPGSTAQTYYPTTTAAYHAPRFDYSPTNIGEPRGLLIEGLALNLTTYSDNLANVNWTKDNSGGFAPVVTTVSATNPANGSTVNQIVFDKTGGVFSRIGRTSTGTTSTPYTMSVWMRTVSGSANVGLRIGADPAGFNCAVTTTFQRFQYTYTLSNTDSTAQIMLWDNITGNSETATVYVWGCQVELGSSASSYIPTGASQVTRNPDLLAVTSTTTMGLNTSEGTFFVETELPRAGITSPAQFGTPYANGYWLGQFYNAADATTLTANWWGGSGLSLPRSGNPKSLTALSYGFYTGTSIPVSSSLNGAVTTGTFTTSGANNAPNPAIWSFITLACNSTGSSLSTTSRDNFNGCIKRFKYFPTRLTDAQLQTLTTP